MGLISRVRGRKTALTNQADTLTVSSYLSTNSMTECRNVLINRQHHFEPRTPQNLKKLHAYVRRHYKTKNIFDRRTRAWKYLVNHDSEAGRKHEA